MQRILLGRRREVSRTRLRTGEGQRVGCQRNLHRRLLYVDLVGEIGRAADRNLDIRKFAHYILHRRGLLARDDYVGRGSVYGGIPVGAGHIARFQSELVHAARQLYRRSRTLAVEERLHRNALRISNGHGKRIDVGGAGSRRVLRRRGYILGVDHDRGLHTAQRQKTYVLLARVGCHVVVGLILIARRKRHGSKGQCCKKSDHIFHIVRVIKSFH